MLCGGSMTNIFIKLSKLEFHRLENMKECKFEKIKFYITWQTKVSNFRTHIADALRVTYHDCRE